MERRLAAIMAADVVGYTRLMACDQARTLDALRQLREQSFNPVVAEHRGSLIKNMGDGWIVEFASVFDAIGCAIEIQESLSTYKLIQLRIGIHVGEVVHEADDIFGDGVNIAARLEALAEPGQVMISENVHQSLDERMSTLFAGGEPQSLKNVPRKIAVWHWPATTPSEGTTGTGPIAASPAGPRTTIYRGAAIRQYVRRS